MIPDAPRVRRLAALAALALAAGGAVAQVGHSSTPAAPAVTPPSPVVSQAWAQPARSSRARAPMARAPRAPAPLPALTPVEPAPLPARSCPERDRKPVRNPPSEALRNAFGILRSDPDRDDALPAKALGALKARGLQPVDPQSARLLRADRAARAWVVPVPDVDVGTPRACAPGATPREGLAVVAADGAPAGGGAALRDLQRGIAAPVVDPCAGAGRNMLGVSGIVPDGVAAVFITAPDGTSTRADVRDNGYAFVLARPRRPEPRYVVWTGSDGVPHVQPLAPFAFGGRAACPRVDLPPRVTPDMWSPGCAALAGLPAYVAPLRPPRRAAPVPRGRPRLPPRRPSLARPILVMPPAAVFGPCPAGVPPALVMPRPALPPAMPAPPRPPMPRRAP